MVGSAGETAKKLDDKLGFPIFRNTLMGMGQGIVCPQATTGFHFQESNFLMGHWLPNIGAYLYNYDLILAQRHIVQTGRRGGEAWLGCWVRNG